ncbi:MAG: dihydroxyacetone kinase subunit L [Candidatus Thorarchaeota archaeon]|nr:dihydroxyacetone kinase subunit L [Candidatus Thorarchaeota archaeon]
MHLRIPPISRCDSRGDFLITSIQKEDLLRALGNISKIIAENENYLTELDSAIGDGDHGVNLRRGFDSLNDKLPSFKDKEIHEILVEVGRSLLETVGGSVGVLYGSAIIEAGKAVGDKKEISLDDLVRMVDAAEGAIRSRGQVDVGEKTMLDTIHPFSVALREATEENLHFADTLDRGLEAAKKGLESTKQMVAKKGRAKYLGEKTLGHQDVGATSSYLMIESFVETIKEIDQNSS